MPDRYAVRKSELRLPISARRRPGSGRNACENRELNPSALRWALPEVRRGVGYDASLGGDSVTLQLI
jgi:hypothetical protein